MEELARYSGTLQSFWRPFSLGSLLVASFEWLLPVPCVIIVELVSLEAVALTEMVRIIIVSIWTMLADLSCSFDQLDRYEAIGLCWVRNAL